MATFPLINGHRFSWSSIEINVNGTLIRAIKEISYSNNLEPGEMRGTHAQKGGRTRGELKPEASMTIYLEEYNELIKALGQGFLERQFDIVVSYSEKNAATVTDKIIGARIKKPEKSFSSGTDALAVKCDLDIMFVIENGLSPIDNALGVTLG